MRISIMGCGWLGLAIGRALVEQGHRVKGSTTRVERRQALETAGITPHVLKLEPALSGDLEGFFDAELLIYTVPPARRADIESYYPEQMRRLLDALAGTPVERLVLTGSTSVYPPKGQVADEEDRDAPESATGRALLEVESLILARFPKSLLLRLAGLYGPGRAVGDRVLKGRAQPRGGDTPVNLVHRADVVAACLQLLARGLGGVFNVCAPSHPTRQELYRARAEALGLAPPTLPESGPYKIVSSEKLIRTLEYRFLHPRPLDDSRAPAS